MRYLVCGLDEDLSSSLREAFQATHNGVEFVDSLEDAEQLLRFDEFDVALFGVDDFERGAVALARRLRAAKCRTPILLIGRCIEAAMAERWLETVDDVIRQPIDLRELMARMSAVARRSLGMTSARIVIENVSIDMSAESVRVDGCLVHTTRSEFQMLTCLATRQNRVADKEYILSAMYQDRNNEPEMKILDVFVCKLRKKLTEAGAKPDFIKTAWGRGWFIRADPPPSEIGMPRMRTGVPQFTSETQL